VAVIVRSDELRLKLLQIASDYDRLAEEVANLKQDE
jgi:hypothetical protein